MKTFVALLVALSTLMLSAAERKSVALFDGKSTDAFKAYNQKEFPKEGWKVEDGVLKTVAGGHGGDIVTKDRFEDFDLRFEWKVMPGANSGVMYGVQEGPDAPWYTGPEYQVLDNDKHADGKNPKTSAAALYALIAPNDSKKVKPVGEWNEGRIIAKGTHVEHWLNGTKVVEYEWGSAQVQALIEQSKFKPMEQFMKRREGHIVFQHHGYEVWYRRIQVRKL
jgi:hypothetical protein